MRRFFVATLAVTMAAAGCAQPDVQPPGDAITTSPAGTTTIPAPPPSVNVAFLLASSQDEMQVRFPVFWGTNRMPDVRMTKTGDVFSATVPFPRGALIQYEYSVPTLDYEHREQYEPGVAPLRHLLVADGLVLDDVPYAFDAAAVPLPARVYGNVTDATTGKPVLEPWLAIDGILVSAMNGEFEAEVRDRAIRVTVFTLDGSFQPQSRLVSPGRADFQLQPAAPAQVTIRLQAEPPQHHQVRVYGSAAQFGLIQTYLNRYLHETYRSVSSDLILDLYDGQWVDYLYTVGNAALSYEHHNGEPVVRSLVARNGLVVNDVAGLFTQPGATTLRVQTPAYTDPNEVVGIQYLDPRLVHMHPAGDHEWVLEVSGRNIEGQRYRYFRGWSGVGDEAMLERLVQGTAVTDTVTAWKTQRAALPTPAVPTPSIQNKFRIMPFLPDWWSTQHALSLEKGLDHFAAEGLPGFLPAQVWGYERFEPTVKIRIDRPMTLYTPQFEMARIVRSAHAKGLDVVVTPQLVLPEGYGPGHQFPAAWWPGYMAEIERFNLHMARSAEAADVDGLEVVGKSPFFGMPAEIVDDYDALMEATVAKVRALYSGDLFAQYDEFQAGLDWWRQTDAIMQLNYNLGLDGNATQAQIDAKVESVFENRYKPQVDAAGKPLIIKLGVHSVDGAAGGREVPEADGPASERNRQYPLDNEEQRMIYEAYYKAATKRTWVKAVYPFVHGFVVGPEARDVVLDGKPADALTAAWANAIGPT